jgi:hypothetical protein
MGAFEARIMMLPKPKRITDKKYLQFIRELLCIICMKPAPSEPHHWNEKGQGGMGTKCSDYRTIPLCFDHHREAHLEKRTFLTEYRLEIEDVIEMLNKKWERKDAKHKYQERKIS